MVTELKAGTDQFSGTQKAAVLLLSLGAEISAKIFKTMNDD